MSDSKTLLLDGDIIAYQCAAAAEHPTNWGDGLWTLHSYEHEVEAAIDDYVYKLQEAAGIDRVATAISHTKNFRKRVAPYYKGNRKDIRKPMLLLHAKAYLSQRYTGIILNDLEADDVLGLYATSMPDEYVIWSLDKDLRSIPGFHLIDGNIEEITKDQADLAFYTQVLTGDMVDNYAGCPKVGPKTAEKILAGLTDREVIWAAIVNAYTKAGLNEDVAIENAQLARILRDGEYDVETGEVFLWQP